MACPTVQYGNNFPQPTVLSRTTTPSRTEQVTSSYVDSILKQKLDNTEASVQVLSKSLKEQLGKNKILEAQVTSLEGFITQLLSQAEQYHFEALVNEKRVKELEAKLEKEVSKRHAHTKTVQKLDNAVDRVKSLEKQLKVQIDMRSQETLADDQLAWSVAETSSLQNRVRELEKEVSLQKHFRHYDQSVISEPSELNEAVAADAVELSLMKDRIAMDLNFAPSMSGPCEDYAFCVVENYALKAQVEEFAGVRAIQVAEEIQLEAQSHQLDVIDDQLEQLKSLEAQYDELSAECQELEVRRSSVSILLSSIPAHNTERSYAGLDDQLAYALVENCLLRDSALSQ